MNEWLVQYFNSPVQSWRTLSHAWFTRNWPKGNIDIDKVMQRQTLEACIDRLQQHPKYDSDNFRLYNVRTGEEIPWEALG